MKPIVRRLICRRWASLPLSPSYDSWFAHRGFHEAIGRLYDQERAALDARIAALAPHSAYRSPA